MTWLSNVVTRSIQTRKYFSHTCTNST
ncbi:hypothetical protein F383_35164 [Gossypium arboreum]|uniref:Uncharacterized protein n=1 Tax=Gossypium arboreum TaxID=29729 RepID=A0A0B0N4X2_GOSAR|nr:hypothetical protein F383_35164 [Gossypium arboreum]